MQISREHKLSHLGSCLTALPIIEEIYETKKPEEKFVLSAGHAHLAHLVVKESHGLISQAETERLLQEYGIHCDTKAGCDVSTGSLGLGLPVAVGMAMADKSKDVYCLVSDGEMAEGSIWEALEVVRKYKVTNLKLYVNANGWSAYDKTNLPILRQKLRALRIPFEWRETNSDIGTWAVGLASHYKVADENLK